MGKKTDISRPDPIFFTTPKYMQWQKGKVVVLWPWEVATGKIMYPFPAWDARGKAAADKTGKK